MSASLVGSVCWGGWLLGVWLLMVASVAAIRAGDAGASVAYYVDRVSHDRHDYYAGHGEAPGVWRGAFAEHLGLSGHVAAEDFRAVLEGHDPSTGEPLKPRANHQGFFAGNKGKPQLPNSETTSGDGPAGPSGCASP